MIDMSSEERYVPPLTAIQRAIQVAGLEQILTSDHFAHVDPGTVGDLLSEAGRMIAEEIAPLNRIGDEVGSKLSADGNVVTPPGFAQAYRTWVEAGWGSIGGDPEHGGGGFPLLVTIGLQEMLKAANLAFSLCPMLSLGAVELISHYGTTEQKDLYLPKLISGEWTGTMNLTEPEAGSDLGLLRCHAAQDQDGSWRIRGTKIFITWGDHDMAENIIHLVLARTPGAPAGHRGISCFIVPKLIPGNDGQMKPNDIRCVRLEEKVGIHASPTCQLSYGEAEGAVGELIGDIGGGMAAMFVMMNRARLAVGVEGLSVASRATEKAVSFAHQRLQGRHPGDDATKVVPIVEHPDVRRMLLTMTSLVYAMRHLLYEAAATIDLSSCHPDESERLFQADLAAFYTPMCKAWCTDTAVEVTSLAMQVHGGMGYIEETGVAQYWRDARITPIYEGTNGIQAIDLAMRKLSLRDGAIARHLLELVAEAAKSASDDPELEDLARTLLEAHEAATAATEWLLKKRADHNDVLAGATPYLQMMATTVTAGLMVRASLHRTDDTDERAQLSTVRATRFFCTHIVPRTKGLLPTITAGASFLETPDLDLFLDE